MTDRLSTGQNIIVAIGVYAGFNEDDAVCVNRGSSELGMFNCTLFKMYEEAERNDTKLQVSEHFYNPLLRYQQEASKAAEAADSKNKLSDAMGAMGERSHPQGYCGDTPPNYKEWRLISNSCIRCAIFREYFAVVFFIIC
jgi:hypothetical protein